MVAPEDTGRAVAAPAAPGGSARSEVLPFAAMSATSEAPAAFRHAAARPGPLRLIGEAIEDIRSRRRLVRYLVQADIKKKGADTFLGNLWWILDPLLQMGVYVVFVSLILDVKTPDYPLFILSAILPWKWFTTSIGDAASSVVSQEKLIKQIQFPKIVLPVAATTAGVVGFAFGLMPLAAIMLLYPHRISPFLLLIPVIAVVQFVFTLGDLVPGLGDQRVLPRPRQRPAARAAPLVLPVARPVQHGRRRCERDLPEQSAPAHARARQPVRDPVRVVPRGHLRPARGTAACPRLARRCSPCWSRASCCSRSGPIVFKRLEPTYAKVL